MCAGEYKHTCLLSQAPLDQKSNVFNCQQIPAENSGHPFFRAHRQLSDDLDRTGYPMLSGKLCLENLNEQPNTLCVCACMRACVCSYVLLYLRVSKGLFWIVFFVFGVLNKHLTVS